MADVRSVIDNPWVVALACLILVLVIWATDASPIGVVTAVITAGAGIVAARVRRSRLGEEEKAKEKLSD